jgi:hypothetical protein
MKNCLYWEGSTLSTATTQYKLKDRFKNKEFAFVLGAGATKEAAFPSWIELVEALCIQTKLPVSAVTPEKVIEIVGAIENRLILDFWKNQFHLRKLRDMVDRMPAGDDIKKLLCRPSARARIATLVHNNFRQKANSFVTNLKGESNQGKKEREKSLMNTIATICGKRTEHRMRTTVVTYNYDDYFQYCYKISPLYKKELDNPRKEAYIKNRLRTHDFTNLTPPIIREHACHGVDIYHVHGSLPVFDISSTSIRNHYDAGIVLSSHDYFELSDTQVAGWTNQVQYSIFSALPIMIIGFSMEDPNFRAIINRLRNAKMLNTPIVMVVSYDATINGDEENACNAKLFVKALLAPLDCDPKNLHVEVCEKKKIPEWIRNYVL